MANGRSQESPRRRRSSSREDLTAAVEFEWLDVASDGVEIAGGDDRTKHVAAYAVLALLTAACVAVLVLLSGPTASDGEPDDAAPTSVAPSPTARPAVVAEVETPIIDQLPSAPADWFEGLALAWIDADADLRVRDVTTGEDLETSLVSTVQVPPLPSRTILLGAENGTWLLDPEALPSSGQLSNTVRVVRLGAESDSYAFMSTGDDGSTQFFLGSLWGPAMSGLTSTEASTGIIPVVNRGVVLSTTAAESSTIASGGLTELPSRLGRIVAADTDSVAGIHCDDLARCIGRIARWDGSGEVEVPVESLTGNLVRFTPDGAHVLSINGASWTFTEVEGPDRIELLTVVAPNESLVFSADGARVLWLDEGTAFAMDLSSPVPAVHRVRSLDTLERLPTSDVVLFDPSSAP